MELLEERRMEMRNSGEARLEMIKNIRARSQSNYMAMNKKSQNIQEDMVERKEEISFDSGNSFKIRLAAAVMLFAGFTWMSLTEETFLHKSATDYVEEISAEFDIHSLDDSTLQFLSQISPL